MIGSRRKYVRFYRGKTPAVLALLAPALTACSIVSPGGPFPRLSDPGGCVIEQLTDGNYEEYQVYSASADGRWMTIGSRPGPGGGDDLVANVHEMNLVTGATTDLSHVLTNAGPYSPDGRSIVVAQPVDEGKTDVHEYDRASGRLLPVASHEEWDWLPSYSPDGSLIVFNSYRVDGQSDIFLFEKETGSLTRLTSDPRYEAHGRFSPDGKRILFHRQRGPRDGGGHIFDLVVHDLDTGTETRLTDRDYEESYPAWAPDGRHVVFSSDVNGSPGKLNLYILMPDGRTMTRLTRGDWKDSYAGWSPDGRYIYFNSDRAGPTNVYRVVMDGADCVRDSR